MLDAVRWTVFCGMLYVCLIHTTYRYHSSLLLCDCRKMVVRRSDKLDNRPTFRFASMWLLIIVASLFLDVRRDVAIAFRGHTRASYYGATIGPFTIIILIPAILLLVSWLSCPNWGSAYKMFILQPQIFSEASFSAYIRFCCIFNGVMILYVCTGPIVEEVQRIREPCVQQSKQVAKWSKWYCNISAVYRHFILDSSQCELHTRFHIDLSVLYWYYSQ